MASYALETNGLNYAFSGNGHVLNDINLQVPQGGIYGFLGPNGAGKTTTLRLVLGLLKKQTGHITVFGKPFEQNRVAILQKLGSLIESPSLYSHLTAFENLRLLQKVYQCPGARIEKVLQQVGLSGTATKKAGRFSLGMKQRLGIAVALLHEPSLLILDEPTNGLDPNGIIEVRALLKQLNKEEGITVLISSHLLPEIEKLVNHVGIINRGKMMFQGTLDELKDKQQQALNVIFETGDNGAALEVIKAFGITAAALDGKIVMPAAAKDSIAAINQQLVSKGIAVYEISTVKNDLESIFIDLINN